MNTPNQPDDTDWEAAMSRDFDARVRGLHEAPLDVNAVKGKARSIRRKRRTAVAGGVLAVAAVITPIAVLANNGTNQSEEPPFVETPSEGVDAVPEADYVVGDTWHQADGDEVPLAGTYDSAVIWNDQMVASRFDGEVFWISDVIDEDGTVVDTFETTGPVVINEAGTTIAWVGTDGSVMTRWDGGEVSMGTVDLAAAGETVPWSAAAVTGGPDCNEEADGCTVYLNAGDGSPTVFSSHGTQENPVPDAIKYFDATDDGTVTVFDEVTDFETCGGLFDLEDGEFTWHGCEFQAWQISPGGSYVAGLPSYFDGLGPTQISILDAETGDENGTYTPEGGFIGTWAWADGDHLLFDGYDGANWHLMSMEPGGSFVEIGDPVKGKEFDSPFVLIQH